MTCSFSVLAANITIESRILKTTIPAAMDDYKLVYFVPPSHLQATKHAIHEAGGGVYLNGRYIQCAFEIQGSGQFIPVAEAGANPHTGTPGELENRRVQG